ncbi:glucose PTS transporter subunit EIIB [Frederiksenia canicola]|uniref:PTS EIIB type-1 domain-containing protein n=1 Tax=Frederiksenia canicola TaxID=123824 RepID=A0AAE7C2Z0_9PAST|nr:PTS glucose/sucrose transporter subunit IIB [Frederiksenia canicola]QIM65642.1 hypothetical protein A4G17_09390 [Frederiksenia canicola]
MFGLFKKTTKTESNETLPIDPADLLKALGGEGNIEQISSCITRLRAKLKDLSKVDSEALKTLGAAEVVNVSSGVQAIFGPLSADYAQALNKLLTKE